MSHSGNIVYVINGDHGTYYRQAKKASDAAESSFRQEVIKREAAAGKIKPNEVRLGKIQQKNAAPSSGKEV